MGIRSSTKKTSTSIPEILKRLADLESENERLRTLVESVRCTLVKYYFQTRNSGKDVNVWHYYLGGRKLLTITEVFNVTDHSIKYGKYRYPEHGFKIELVGNTYCDFFHPLSREVTRDPCFFSLSDAEAFIRGFFNGNPDMCVIVDAERHPTIEGAYR